MSESRPSPRRPRRGRPAQPTRKLNFPARVRERIRRGTDTVLGADMAWSAICVLALVALLGTQRCETDYAGTFAVGDVAPQDIRAARETNVIDVELTEARRRAAREAVPQVYVHDAERGTRVVAQLADLFAEGRAALEASSLEDDPVAAARERLAGSFAPDVLNVLLQRRFDPALERELKSVLSQVMSGMIAGNKSLLQREPSIAVVHLPGERRETTADYAGILDLDAARASVADRLRLRLPKGDQRVLEAFAASFVDANLNPDADETQRLRERAARGVPPVLIRIEEGETLIRKGETFTAERLQQLEDVQRGDRRATTPQYLLGLLLIAALTAFFIYRYTRYHQRAFKKIKHLHALMVLMLVSMLGLSRAILWLAGEVSEGLRAPFDQLDAYPYLIPLGAGSILLALLANGRIAMVYSAFTALHFGALNGWDPYLMMWALLVQCAGVYAISTDRERAALLRAGAVVGGAGAITALAMETLQGNLEPIGHSLYGALLALLGGGLGVGLLISFALPMLERLFNVLTDIRLLELSSSTHPLLSQLAMKAPGTYNHSLVVGTLAEEGAKAIGANALFCRVAAFYHDVGKMNKPEYFVENQHQSNPHDQLSPSMSSLIIASHVKDGIKMAREAGLPEQIVDIIPQHHGTRLMTYFYEKAKSQTDPTMGPVKEEDFRYPGPKPQTKEAAIFMIADGVEAAARTVGEPTANRLQDMIVKVSNAIVLDRQFDECDLTFVDLKRIQEALLKRLVSMYHHRIDYPGFDFRGPSDADAPADVQESQVAGGA